MALIKGKQIAVTPDGIATANLNDGVLSADAAGRLKIATGFFDLATVNDKFAANSIADGKLAELYIKADGTRAFTGDQSHGGFKITSLGTPTVAADGATKGYVDSVLEGLSWKDSVRAATTGNITLSGPQTIDTISVIAGDRVLVKNQTTVADNGLYIVNAGTWTRSLDANTGAELEGAAVFVQEGAVNADKKFTQTADNITLGVTSITWVLFSSLESLVAGPGIDKLGDVVSVDLSTVPGLEFDAGGNVGKLRVLVDPNGGIERVAAGVGVLLDGDSLLKGASGLKSVVPTTGNKGQTPSATTGDGQSTGLTIAATPGGDGYVGVSINGIWYEVGDGVKTKDAYFSADGGSTAKTIGTIVATDVLFWNGVVVGFDLATSDRVDMYYEV